MPGEYARLHGMKTSRDESAKRFRGRLGDKEYHALSTKGDRVG